MRLLGYRRIGLFDNYGLGTAVSTFAIFAFALLAGAGGAACSCLGSHRLGLDNLYFRSLLGVPVTACGHHESGHSHDANER